MILRANIKGRDVVGIPSEEVSPSGEFRMVGVEEGNKSSRYLVSKSDAVNYVLNKGQIDFAYRLIGRGLVEIGGKQCYEVMAVLRTVPGTGENAYYGSVLLDKVGRSLERHVSEVSQRISDLRPLFAPVDLRGEDPRLMYGGDCSVVDGFYPDDPDQAQTLNEDPDKSFTFSEALARRGIDPDDFSFLK